MMSGSSAHEYVLKEYTTRVIRPRAQDIFSLIKRVAREEILPKFRNLDASEVAMKRSKTDLVTVADKAAEARLTKGLLQLFPSARIVGEESVAADPTRRDNIAQEELCFILDPIDGTWNYANGLSLFGVIIAATHYGKPIFALLYDPLIEDAHVALADDGCAFVSGGEITGGTDLKVATHAEITGFVPVHLFPREQRAEVAAAATKFARFASFHCSCHEYRLLSQGSFHFSLANILNPWDHVAGTMMVEAAGGFVSMLDGRPYTVDAREGYLVAASDQDVFKQVQREFSFLIH